MQDPIEKLQATETFQKLDRKVDWAQVTLFTTVVLLALVGVGKSLIA